MREAVSHWKLVGFPVPQFSNPTDHFLDLVSPGVDGEQIDTFLEYYDSHLQPGVTRQVDVEMRKRGKTPLEVLEEERQRYLAWGHLPPVAKSKYGTGFGKQLAMVTARKVSLCLRDREGIVTEYCMKAFMGVIMGIAFWGYGKKEPQPLLGLLFFLVIQCAMAGMETMPKLIDERVILKMETSDALYSEWAFIMSSGCINLLTGFVGNAIFVTILFVMSQMDWALFPSAFLWSTLVWGTFIALFDMVAAISKDMAASQNTATPFLMLFMLWNGFTTTKGSAAPWTEWILWINPMAYGIEAIAMDALENEDPGSMERAQWEATNKLAGYKDNKALGILVMIVFSLIFRIGQVVALKTLNKIEK
jgi:hypothetical protein